MAAGPNRLVDIDDVSEGGLAVRREFTLRVGQLVRPPVPDEVVTRSWQRVKRHLSGDRDPAWTSRRPVETALRLRDLRLTVQDAAAGDEDAKGALYESYAREIGGLLRQRVGAHDADDLMHAVFERVWAALERGDYDDQRPFGKWLRTIALNVRTDYLRRQWRVELTDPNVVRQLRDAHGPILVTDPTVEKALGWMTDHELAGAMRLLSPMQRKVLTLSCVGGCSNDEIADILGTSASSVAFAKSEGLGRLRKHPAIARRNRVVQRSEESLASTRRTWRPRRLHGFSLLPRLSRRWT